MTIRRRLEKMGFRRERAATLPARQDEPERRYGFQPAYRRQRPVQRYPSSLTDAEWRLVADLFGEEGQRDTPPRYPRRLLIDACCYVVRSGCCPGAFHLGRTSIERSASGANRAGSYGCMIDYGRNGENVRGATRFPARLYWMPNRHGVHRRVEPAATMQERRSRA